MPKKSKKTTTKPKKSKPNIAKAIEKAVDRHNRLDEKFHNLMMRAIEKAEQVDCSLVEFRGGLATMFSTLRERLNQVDDELRDKTETEPQEYD